MFFGIVHPIMAYLMVRYPCQYVLKPHAQSLSRVWLCDTVNCSPPGSSVYGIAQAKMLEWVAISSSRGSSWPRDRTCISCIGRWILHHWATWEVLNLTLKGVFNTPYFLSVTYVFLHAVLSSEMPAFSFRFHFYFYLLHLLDFVYRKITNSWVSSLKWMENTAVNNHILII